MTPRWWHSSRSGTQGGGARCGSAVDAHRKEFLAAPTGWPATQIATSSSTSAVRIAATASATESTLTVGSNAGSAHARPRRIQALRAPIATAPAMSASARSPTTQAPSSDAPHCAATAWKIRGSGFAWPTRVETPIASRSPSSPQRGCLHDDRCRKCLWGKSSGKQQAYGSRY